MKKTFLIISAILIGHLQLVHCQSHPTDPKALITSFLKEVYQTKNSSQVIARNYIDLSKESNEFSPAKRYDIASKHIDMLREGKSISDDNSTPISSGNLNKVVIKECNSFSINDSPYFDLNKKQKINVYVAVINNKKVKCFFVEKGKILSFDYVKKGQNGPAYFFSY